MPQQFIDDLIRHYSHARNRLRSRYGLEISLEEWGRINDLFRQDREVNRLNKEVFRLAVAVGDEVDRREWAMTLTLMARAIERIGDNAVGVGEQVVFVETGLFKEFPSE